MHSTMNLGGCVVSKNILEKRGRVKWCFREESVNNIDNGWRFLSEIDTDEFLADSKNMVICDWGTIFEIEPAIAPIFECPALEILFWSLILVQAGFEISCNKAE